MHSFALGLLIFNLAAIPSLLWKVIRYRNWIQTSSIVEGKEKEQLGDTFVWIPSLRYLVEGKEFQTRYRGVSGYDNYRIGERRPILVDPSRHDAIVLGSHRSLLLPLSAIILLDTAYALSIAIRGN